MSSSNSSDATSAKRATIADTPSARKRASVLPEVASEAHAEPLVDDEQVDDEQVDDERPTIPVPPNAP